MTARTGRDPGEAYAALTERFGSPVYKRIDAPATPEQKAALGALSPDAVAATELAGEAITARLTAAPGNGAAIGGLKVVTEQGWFAARPSGTENVTKLYAESFIDEAHLERIIEEAKAIVADGPGGLMPESPQEHMRRAPRIRPWLNLERTASDQYGHKMHLYVLAAPVFQEHGYRGATIKALAHACHLSPSSLYHYFGSKAEMATYPLTGPAIDWDNAWIEPDIDPLEQLGVLLEMAVSMFPIWTLALRLHEEIHGGPDPRMQAAGWGQGEAVFGRLIYAVAPDMERRDAERLARDVLASLAGTAVTALDDDVMEAQLVRMREVLRAGLVPAHVEAERFDAAKAVE